MTLSVLVVDDDRSQLSTMEEILSALGLRVVTVDGLDEMRSALMREAFELGYFDLEVRGCLSISVIEELLLTEHRFPFAMMTGRSDFRPPSSLTGSGLLVGTLYKPLRVEEIRSVYRRILQQWGDTR